MLDYDIDENDYIVKILSEYEIEGKYKYSSDDGEVFCISRNKKQFCAKHHHSFRRGDNWKELKEI